MNTSFKLSAMIFLKIFTFIYFLAVLLILALINNASAQDLPLKGYENGFVPEERFYGDINDMTRNTGIENSHKSALESGNFNEASVIESEMERKTHPENRFLSRQNNDVYFEKAGNNTGNDWMTPDSMIHNGLVKSLPSYNRQIELKYDDNNNLYAAVNLKETSGSFTGKVAFYRSVNNGLNWVYLGSILSPLNTYITNISMLVESRSNDHDDSTRIILFYTKSSGNNNNLSVLSFVSFRITGTGFLSGDIFSSSIGKEVSHISAVSDGAYFQNGTYIGVVCTESNSNYDSTFNIRFFRSANWGNTWTGAAINTGANDFYPSADYFLTGSQLYIVAERKHPSSRSDLAFIKTSWSPSSSFFQYSLANLYDYKRPVITIRKNNTVDSMIVTTTINGMASYLGSPNGGDTWYGFSISQAGSRYIFSHCSSSKEGFPHFSMVFGTDNSDSITLRRGYIGLMGLPVTKVNSVNFDINIQPVCALSSNETNLPSVLYSGTNGSNAYFDQEGMKYVIVQFLQQGYYNPSTGRMNMKDTSTLYLRRASAPFDIVDSAKGITDSVSYCAYYQFSGISGGSSYYLSVKHRNCIETWSSVACNFILENNYYYNFASDSSSAYGKNLARVNHSPRIYGLYSGDVDLNNSINLNDIILIYNDAAVFEEGYINSDITGDRITNLSDLTMTYNNSVKFITSVSP